MTENIANGSGFKDQVYETTERWKSFLGAMSERMGLLGEEAIAEVSSIAGQESSTNNTELSRILMGINGQFSQMLRKVREVEKEKIKAFFDHLSRETDLDDSQRELLDASLDECYELTSSFEQEQQNWVDRIEDAGKEDPQKKYSRILEEYEAEKNGYRCSQCGSSIRIPKIFFLDTYLSCPSCFTQNTYRPGIRAKELEGVAWALAQKRRAGLLGTYEQAKKEERRLYHEILKLQLRDIDGISANAEAECDAMEEMRKDIVRKIPKLYEEYLSAVYLECGTIVPDMKEYYDRICREQISKFRNPIK